MRDFNGYNYSLKEEVNSTKFVWWG